MRMVILLVVLMLPGCAGLKPVVNSIHDVAKQLCGLFFSKRDGVSVEQAVTAFCMTEQQLRPWIEEATRAQKLAGARAVK